jgi:hypothetical protein
MEIDRGPGPPCAPLYAVAARVICPAPHAAVGVVVRKSYERTWKKYLN